MMLLSSTVPEMSQQDTNPDIQVSIIHASVRNVVRAICLLQVKLQIVIIQIFICKCRPYNVQICIILHTEIFWRVFLNPLKWQSKKEEGEYGTEERRHEKHVGGKLLYYLKNISCTSCIPAIYVWPYPL
jgi:hypothetical protein